MLTTAGLPPTGRPAEWSEGREAEGCPTLRYSDYSAARIRCLPIPSALLGDGPKRKYSSRQLSVTSDKLHEGRTAGRALGKKWELGTVIK